VATNFVALDGLGDFRVAEVVLLPLRVRPHVFRRHQPGIMAKPSQPAAEIGTNTGLHADQAGRHVGKARLLLATGPPLPQRDCPTPIEADDVKGVLADIDTHHGDRTPPPGPALDKLSEILQNGPNMLKRGSFAAHWPGQVGHKPWKEKPEPSRHSKICMGS
jgi:hypothetical protein